MPAQLAATQVRLQLRLGWGQLVAQMAPHFLLGGSAEERAQLVDVASPAGITVRTRCVRRAFLLGEGEHNRKPWLQNRLRELAGIKLVDCTGPAFSRRKGFDLGGAGSDFRAAGL